MMSKLEEQMENNKYENLKKDIIEVLEKYDFDETFKISNTDLAIYIVRSIINLLFATAKTNKGN